MGGTDGDGEGIATGTGGELDHFLGLGVVRLLGGDLVLDTGQDTQLSLDRHVMGVGVLDDLLGEGDVLLERQGAGIDHHGRETVVDAALAELEGITVVEVQADLGMLPSQFLGILDSTLGHVLEEGLVGVVARALGDLQDHRGFLLGAGLDDGLELLHVVEIERRDRIASLHRLGKHLSGVDKTQIFE